MSNPSSADAGSAVNVGGDNGTCQASAGPDIIKTLFSASVHGAASTPISAAEGASTPMTDAIAALAESTEHNSTKRPGQSIVTEGALGMAVHTTAVE